MMRSLLVFSMTLVLWSPVARAVEARLTAEASVDRSTVLLGDPIQYVVTLKYPQGVVVEWPSIGGTRGEFAVEASGAEPPHRADGGMTEERRYRLASYSAGIHTIPETVVTYRMSDGATTQEARTKPVTMTVKSLLPTDWERQDIREAKPLIPIRSGWWWLFGALAVVGGLVGAWWWRQRRHERGARSSAPPRPAHEIAFAALLKLRHEDLPSHNHYEEYYVKLSGIVRTYIEARFGLKAPEMTTEEFLQAASNAQALSLDHRRLLQEFLERSDLVKFARYEPSRHEADEAFEAARRLVQETAPVAEPAATKVGKTA